MKELRVITESEYNQKAEKAFRTVFKVYGPFGELFTPLISERTLIYPAWYSLTESQLQALVQAVKSVGDDAFYLSLLERIQDPDEAQHWFIPLDDVETYRSVPWPVRGLENALYSPTGRWGIKFTMDQYAIVGGSRIFMDTLFAHLSISVDEQAHKFLLDHKPDQDTSDHDLRWLTGFLTNLYGQAKARKMLLEIGL